MSVGPTFRAVRGGIARRRLQTIIVALVVLVSTAATVLALALVVDSNAPFDHAFSAQRGADIVAAVDPAVVRRVLPARRGFRMSPQPRGLSPR